MFSADVRKLLRFITNTPRVLEKREQHMECNTPLLLWFTTFCHVHHMNLIRTWTFCMLFFPCIPSSCLIVSLRLQDDFFLLKFSSLFSCLLSDPSLSLCLGCVWPCLSLPLQEVVSRLIESRLWSLELNTCSEELLFNCSSHTLLTCTHTWSTYILCLIWPEATPLFLLCLFFFCLFFFFFLLFTEEERWMRKGGR